MAEDQDALFAKFLGEIDTSDDGNTAIEVEAISKTGTKRDAEQALGADYIRKEQKKYQQSVVSAPAKPIIVSAGPVLVAPLVPTPETHHSLTNESSTTTGPLASLNEMYNPGVAHMTGYILPPVPPPPPPQPMTPFQQQQSAYQYVPPKEGDHAGQDRNIRSKPKKFLRVGGGSVWKDDTLNDWPDDDFRLFVGDLGNEVTDEALTACFNTYASFQKAKVIRDKHNSKSRGYGFVSFKDGFDMMHAMREKQGKYLGNRPMKIKKSTWQDRNIKEVRKKEKMNKKEKRALGLL